MRGGVEDIARGVGVERDARGTEVESKRKEGEELGIGDTPCGVMLSFVGGTVGVIVGGRGGRAAAARCHRRRTAVCRAGSEGDEDPMAKEDLSNAEIKQRERDREMADIDRDAELWIGTDLDRWYWYESMKAKRKSLEKDLIEREKDVEGSVEELKRTLRELQNATELKFLKGEDEEFTPLAYAMFSIFISTPIVISFWISYELSKALSFMSEPF